MQVTIKPTNNVTNYQGTPCRVWVGRTDQGIACAFYVARHGVERLDQEQVFEQALREHVNPELTYIEPIALMPIWTIQQLQRDLNNAREMIQQLNAELATRPAHGPGWGEG